MKFFGRHLCGPPRVRRCRDEAKFSNMVSANKKLLIIVGSSLNLEIQFTVGRPADLDSAYFSESESVKLA